jgi:glycosyltransferase involved in cell wall biosynthesis
MALDEQRWQPRDTPSPGETIRIGWSGHPVNFRYLLEIESALVDVQKRFPATEFAVFSGQKPPFSSLKFLHLPFAGGSEPEVLRTFDIGLLPLPDDAFSAGKSPIKGLQYMASGAAVALSPVGAAAEMFSTGQVGLFARHGDEWVAALSSLISNAGLRGEMARKGRKAFEERFSLSANLPRVTAAWTGQVSS